MLLEIAADSIESGLDTGKPATVDIERLPERLLAKRACFVTLILKGRLRGCIGTLEADTPLAVNVAKYAFAAAFSDPRFTPLTSSEFPLVDIEISILSPLEEIRFSSESELLDQIRPGKHGLFISDRGSRGTLLPSVWEQIPDKREFLEKLKIKAGLSRDYWSDSMKVFRYEAYRIE